MSELRYEFIMSQIKHIRDIKENEKTKISLVFYEGCQGPCIFKICKNRNLIDVYQALMEVRHTNLAVIYDCVYEDGDTYVLEEYIPGKTLAEILEEKGPFSEKETTRIMIDLCKGLDKLHHHNPQIIHNDIKTSNIMIKEDGGVKLFDFDISRIYKDGAYKNTKLLGTYEYAAPEHYGFGQSEPCTDIYSLGVTMHEMLTGTGLNHERTVTYQGSLTKIVQKCVEIDRKKRYASAALLKTALEKHYPLVIAADKTNLGFNKKMAVCICLVILLAAGGLFLNHYINGVEKSETASGIPGNNSENDLGIDSDKNTEDNVGTEELVGTEDSLGTEEVSGTEESKGTEEISGTEETEGTEDITGTEESAETEGISETEESTGNEDHTGSEENDGAGGVGNSEGNSSDETATEKDENESTDDSTHNNEGTNNNTGNNTNSGNNTNTGMTDGMTGILGKQKKIIYEFQGKLLAMETWTDDPVVWVEKISENYYLKTSDGKEKLLEEVKASYGAQLACNPYTNQMYLLLYHYDDYSIYSVDKELNVNFVYKFDGSVIAGYKPINFFSDGTYVFGRVGVYKNVYSINNKRYGIVVKSGKLTFLELDVMGNVVNEFPLSGYSVDQHDSSIGPPMYDSGDAVYFCAFNYSDSYVCRFDGEKYEMIVCLDDYIGYNRAAFDYLCITDTAFRCYSYADKAILEFVFE